MDHSNKFYYLKETGPINKKKIVADALITKRKKIIIGVLTADCVPVLIFDEKKKLFQPYMLDGKVPTKVS